jgi:hypothetical protein
MVSVEIAKRKRLNMNAAVNTTPIQWQNWAAAKAIDGLNSTFSHTADLNAWWEVQLNETVEVEELVVLNRYCQVFACSFAQLSLSSFRSKDHSIQKQRVSCNKAVEKYLWRACRIRVVLCFILACLLGPWFSVLLLHHLFFHLL